MSEHAHKCTMTNTLESAQYVHPYDMPRKVSFGPGLPGLPKVLRNVLFALPLQLL